MLTHVCAHLLAHTLGGTYPTIVKHLPVEVIVVGLECDKSMCQKELYQAFLKSVLLY